MTEEMLFQKKFLEWIIDNGFREEILSHFGLDNGKTLSACPSWEDVLKYTGEHGILNRFLGQ